MPDKFRDPKLWIGLGAGAVALWVLAPNATGGVLRLLPLAACPLMMVVMMKAMTGGASRRDSQEPQPGGATEPSSSTAERQLSDLRAELDALKADREPPLERGSGPPS